MDLLKNLYKKTFEKIDDSNAGFCGTQSTDVKTLATQVAQSLFVGKENADDLLQNAGKQKKHNKSCSKGCTH
ncbi:MAG: hypothetical protein K2X77_02140 [Candidatus Obscuribacterales bacterium]|jgi:hypothetical protein|nr:hypothetical protein [Candidatus Obscuribacterales bacterium]